MAPPQQRKFQQDVLIPRYSKQTVDQGWGLLTGQGESPLKVVFELNPLYQSHPSANDLLESRARVAALIRNEQDSEFLSRKREQALKYFWSKSLHAQIFIAPGQAVECYVGYDLDELGMLKDLVFGWVGPNGHQGKIISKEELPDTLEVPEGSVFRCVTVPEMQKNYSRQQPLSVVGNTPQSQNVCRVLSYCSIPNAQTLQPAVSAPKPVLAQATIPVEFDFLSEDAREQYCQFFPGGEQPAQQKNVASLIAAQHKKISDEVQAKAQEFFWGLKGRGVTGRLSGKPSKMQQFTNSDYGHLVFVNGEGENRKFEVRPNGYRVPRDRSQETPKTWTQAEISKLKLLDNEKIKPALWAIKKLEFERDLLEARQLIFGERGAVSNFFAELTGKKPQSHLGEIFNSEVVQFETQQQMHGPEGQKQICFSSFTTDAAKIAQRFKNAEVKNRLLLDEQGNLHVSAHQAITKALRAKMQERLTRDHLEFKKSEKTEKAAEAARVAQLPPDEQAREAFNQINLNAHIDNNGYHRLKASELLTAALAVYGTGSVKRNKTYKDNDMNRFHSQFMRNLVKYLKGQKEQAISITDLRDGLIPEGVGCCGLFRFGRTAKREDALIAYVDNPGVTPDAAVEKLKKHVKGESFPQLFDHTDLVLHRILRVFSSANPNNRTPTK